MAEVQMADGEGMQPLPRTLHSMNAYLGYAGRVALRPGPPLTRLCVCAGPSPSAAAWTWAPTWW